MLTGVPDGAIGLAYDAHVFRPVRSVLVAFWDWAQHIDRMIRHEQEQARVWPLNADALLGRRSEPLRVRPWWFLVFLPYLGVALLLPSALTGQADWKAVVGAALVLAPPGIAWKTARRVHGDAWDATRIRVE